MIRLRRAADRGHADHGWLDTWHTFSFASYLDPEHMGFGALRVINQDRVEPGAGFPMHGHRDMEIITVVLSGALEHRDSMGHRSVVRPGEVQVMSAGTGIRHSETNPSRSETLELLQIWIEPAEPNATPRYDQRAFPSGEIDGRLRLVVSRDGHDGSLVIGQDARMHLGRLGSGESAGVDLAPGRAAWVHVGRGRATLNGRALGSGDGAAITDESRLDLVGVDAAEVLVFDLPPL